MSRGKHVYDERRRLEAENKLRAQQKAESAFDREDEMDRQIAAFFVDVGRIADALEKLADKAT